MVLTTRRLFSCWPAFFLMLMSGITAAEPDIDIEFKADQETGQEWIHAKASYPAKESRTYEAFNAISDYPKLHHWIQNTKAVSLENDDIQGYLIEFTLPWPVGKQWSRVTIQKDDHVISWNQAEGSLNENKGRVVITEHEGQTQVDYRAILDVGYPDAFTRGYKEQFVTEFLSAVHNQLRNEQLFVSAPDRSIENPSFISSM